MDKRTVAYVYNEKITEYTLSKDHPMKPKRIRMVHDLIHSYGIDKGLDLYHSKQATSKQMAQFHHPNYVKYLEAWVNPKTSKILSQYMSEDDIIKARENQKMHAMFKINQSEDCPGFEGLYNFCQLAAGGSIDAASVICTGQADIVTNWAGGFHHAKKTQASGFCYINDIVLCILELLKFHPRVLYLDIDVHHGDGVEEAFYHTNRVMTVSFHQFDTEHNFFPGTGALYSVGEGIGKFYTVNIPLKRGISDEKYLELFKKVMSTVMSNYRPDVLVIQCGADSLSKDKLGHLNLSIKGHSEALKFMRGFNLPMVLLGGGGYTIQNVSRCWVFETAMMSGQQISDQIPKSNIFYEYYSSEDYRIHFPVEERKDENDTVYLNNIIQTITQNLRESEIRPSICFHSVAKPYLPTEQNDFIEIEDSEDSLIDYQKKGKMTWYP